MAFAFHIYTVELCLNVTAVDMRKIAHSWKCIRVDKYSLSLIQKFLRQKRHLIISQYHIAENGILKFWEYLSASDETTWTAVVLFSYPREYVTSF